MSGSGSGRGTSIETAEQDESRVVVGEAPAERKQVRVAVQLVVDKAGDPLVASPVEVWSSLYELAAWSSSRSPMGNVVAVASS